MAAEGMHSPAVSAERAFADFVALHGRRLVHTADLLCGDRYLAEDLVQTALAKLFLVWDRVADPAAYAHRILVNARHDSFRRRRWREISTDALPDTASAADTAADVERRDVVLRALATLAPRERSMVVLRYYADLSEADTAIALGVRVGTVKATCSRALAKLRESGRLDSLHPRTDGDAR